MPHTAALPSHPHVRRPNLPVSVAAGHTASHIDRAAVVGVLAKKHADSQHGGERVLSPGPGLSARTLGGTPRSSRRNRGVHRESSQRGGASVLSCVQPFRHPSVHLTYGTDSDGNLSQVRALMPGVKLFPVGASHAQWLLDHRGAAEYLLKSDRSPDDPHILAVV